MPLLLNGGNNMKIAIPLFGTRVSPNFDHAQTALLVSIEKGCIATTKELSLSPLEPLTRVAQIKSLGIDVVICGGVSSFLQNLLKEQNIRVIPWITGEAQKALELFMRGALEPGTMVCQGRRKRWRFCVNHRREKPFKSDV
jgi:predicted Fe-Mo cluster-binding NifX family protein